MELLGGHKRKAVSQRKAHLAAKERARARAGTVRFVRSPFINILEECFVLIAGHDAPVGLLKRKN